jgi:hypothetical protein
MLYSLKARKIQEGTSKDNKIEIRSKESIVFILSLRSKATSITVVNDEASPAM